MISLAITNYNRSDSVIKSFIQVIDNPLIDEIVIVDDYSDTVHYLKLWNRINNLGSKKDKIKLYRNDINLRPYKNKYTAVSKCSNDWVILLDSDNIIDDEYIRIVSGLEKENDILYVAEILYRKNKSIGWCYESFNKRVIIKKNVRHMLSDDSFEPLLNTGNHFFNKDRYMQVVEKTKEDPLLSVNDAIYFSYLWLLNENRMKVVPGLYYIHQATKDSWWTINSRACRFSASEITKKIKEW